MILYTPVGDMCKNQKRSTEGCSKFKSPETRTSLGEIGLDIRTHASPKVGQDQVSGGVRYSSAMTMRNSHVTRSECP